MNKYCRVCNYCYVYGDMDTCDRCKADYSLSSEPIRTCPVDGVSMTKVQMETVVIDVCDKCKGAWVDGHERELLQRQIHNEGQSQGYSQGMLLGLIVGGF